MCVYVCVYVCMCAQLLSHVWLFVTPWTVAHQARMLEWVAIFSPGDLPYPGIEPISLALVNSLPLSHLGSLCVCVCVCVCVVYTKDFPCGSSGKESACSAGDLGWENPLSPGEGKGYLLQYSGLENSMNCIVLGVTKSQTALSDFCFHIYNTSISSQYPSWQLF